MLGIRSIVASALLLMASTTSVFAQCVPTVAKSPGDHYKPISENQAVLGKDLTVSGVVRAAGDCKPLRNARVGYWQANRKGVYEDRLRAYQFTNARGKYHLKTEWPGGTIPRIHFLVIAEDYKTLITEWIGEQKQESIQVDFVLVPINPSKK